MSLWYRLRKLLGYDHTGTETFSHTRYEYTVRDLFGETHTVEGHFITDDENVAEYDDDTWSWWTTSPVISGATRPTSSPGTVHTDAYTVKEIEANGTHGTFYEVYEKRPLGTDVWHIDVDYATNEILSVERECETA